MWGGVGRILGVADEFQFERVIGFEAENAEAILRSIPGAPGVFALCGAREGDQPYLTRAADLRRRVSRMLAPGEVGADGAPVLSKRLNLRGRVARIEYTVTGSEFESMLVLYGAHAAHFGYPEARRRMRLTTPFFLRLTTEHEHPRVYSTNRLSLRNLDQMYGPFPSRSAADRYCDAVLDLFKLRRCYEDLEVSPSHPGCAYGEMKKCMAPCNESCSAEEYKAEAEAVRAFFETQGQSMLDGIAVERERASAEMEFEQAAALHERFQRVKTAAGLADELVEPVSRLRAVIVQAAAVGKEENKDQAAVFLMAGGCLLGPERMSTLGVRAVKEQTSVGSSLFAQPLMLAAVPLEGTGVVADAPEVRAAGVLARLEAKVEPVQDVAMLSDHLSLLRRWYYRPEKQRAGEIFLPNADGGWPVKRVLRGAARMVLGEPKAMAETDRDGLAAAKVKMLHEGRPDVERAVPVVGRRKRVSQKVVAGE
jgi:hypothetical protein